MELRNAEWLFPAQPRSVPQAHRLIAHTLQHLPDASLEVVLLLAEKLMTNAVLHGTGAVGLHLDWDGEGVRVEVTDPSSGISAALSQDREDPDRRGLDVFDGLSSDWGVLPREAGKGKTVWFTLQA